MLHALVMTGMVLGGRWSSGGSHGKRGGEEKVNHRPPVAHPVPLRKQGPSAFTTRGEGTGLPIGQPIFSRTNAMPPSGRALPYSARKPSGTKFTATSPPTPSFTCGATWKSRIAPADSLPTVNASP